MSATRWTAAALLAAATISTGGWQGAALLAQGGDKYSARLAWVPITGADRVTGKGSATATLSGKTLAISGSFEGLGGPATIARLHQGVAKGARGKPVADVTVPTATSGTFSASIALNDEQLEAL